MFRETSKKIRAAFVFEILGKPPEYIKESLGKIIDGLSKYGGVSIVKKQIHEPKKYEKQENSGLFTTFAEVEVASENLNGIINIVLHEFPAHIEIIEPTELSINNFDLSNALSALAVKLHGYDEMAHAAIMQNNLLAKKLKEVQSTQSTQLAAEKPKEEAIKDSEKDTKDKKGKKKGKKANKAE